MDNLPAEIERDLAKDGVDPSKIGFPHMLPMELALAESPVSEICADYGIDREAFAKLCANTVFKKAYADAVELMRKEGFSFRTKAKMQSEGLLKTAWNLIHALHTPAAVKADLIKATWRVAGLEPKEQDRVPTNPLQINIQLNT